MSLEDFDIGTLKGPPRIQSHRLDMTYLPSKGIETWWALLVAGREGKWNPICIQILLNQLNAWADASKCTG
jgi:hypothetical protein